MFRKAELKVPGHSLKKDEKFNTKNANAKKSSGEGEML